MGYWLAAIAAAAFAIVAGYLFVLNAVPVTVHLSPSTVTTVPLAGALVVAFAVGAIAVGLLAGAGAGRRRWHAWRLARQARREAKRREVTARARDLVWTGDYPQARATLLRAPGELPDDATRVALLAESHLREGDPVEARRVLEQSPALASDPHLLDLLAEAAEAQGDLRAAVDAVERAHLARPGSPRLARRLRDLYATTGRWTDAVNLQGEILLAVRAPAVLDAERSVQRGLRYEAALADPDSRRSARLLGQLAREEPDFTAAWVGAGDRWLAAGRPYLARRAWERGTRHKPAVVLLERLERLDETEHPDRVARRYRRLRARHPEAVGLALLFIRHLLGRDALDDAARELGALPERLATTPPVQALWADLHRRRGESSRAVEAFAQALGPGLGLGAPVHCTQCAHTAVTWVGRCAACHGWDTVAAPADLVGAA